MTSIAVPDHMLILPNYIYFCLFIEYGLELNQTNLVGSLPIFTNSNRLLRWQSLILYGMMHFAYKDDHRRQDLATVVNNLNGCTHS